MFDRASPPALRKGSAFPAHRRHFLRRPRHPPRFVGAGGADRVYRSRPATERPSLSAEQAAKPQAITRWSGHYLHKLDVSSPLRLRDTLPNLENELARSEVPFMTKETAQGSHVGLSIQPPAESLFKPVYDRRGLRLAIVLGNEAPSGICPYAAKNLCYHCDIGLGEGRQFDAAMNLARLRWLQEHYSAIWPEVAHLVVYNSGSVLNRLELAPEVLTAALAFARSLPELRVVSVESREAFVTAESVTRLAADLGPGRAVRVIIGIESADDRLRNQLLRKQMPRRAIERAVRAISTVRQAVTSDGSNAALPGLAANVIVGGPGTTAESTVRDAVETALYSQELAERYGVPLDLNLHPYYPSKRSHARFPDHPRPSLAALADAVCSVHERVGTGVPIFVGLEEEGHDQDLEGETQQAVRLGRAAVDFNRTGRLDLLRGLIESG